MPELPEVETIARALREGGQMQASGRAFATLVGCRITGAQVLWDRTLAAPGVEEFRQRIAGQRIDVIDRRGKYLVFRLTDDTMLVHLRMSGDLLVETVAEPLAPHHRLVLDLDGGLRLAFNDARKFGRVWLLADPGQVLDRLGPEPLDPEFTPEEFYRRLSSRRRQLKPLLMDQGFLAGLGNIYADEALYLAGLHPLTRSHQLTATQAGSLLESIWEVLNEGIRRNGASIDWVYRGGDFQNHFQVYQRSGEDCFRCGTPIQRIVVGQRGTHFCPACQPEG